MEHAIRVEDIGKRFGSVVAVESISFSVPEGTVLGLLGPNGAGKTTTVRMLTTIIRPDRGRATVLGLDVAKAPAAVRAAIGLAGQYAAIDENLTGRENLRMVGQLTHLPSQTIRARADELLERFGLTAAANRPSKTYSGGMRRRLDLAAALVHRPRALFLDEPTTGLDPRSRTDLWAVIQELVADGTTLLLTTQYLEEADRLADNIVVIDDGRIIAEGSASQLKSRLGSTILEVTLADPGGAIRARGVLSRVGAVEAPGDATIVALTIPDDGPAVLAAVRLLDAEGVDVRSIAVRQPTLDDVFLQLTGRSVDEPDQTQKVTA
ncbi:MAG: daunorubicin resistance protein DrrA family ABC transporter ATP-binding protein [Acidimicrobiales bacterium]